MYKIIILIILLVTKVSFSVDITGYAVEKANQALKNNNFTEAVDYLWPAVKSGNPEAASMLGKLYFEGKGVKKDFALAFEMLIYSSHHGYTKDQLTISEMYFKGLGVKKDIIESYKWNYISIKLNESLALEKINIFESIISSNDKSVAIKKAKSILNNIKKNNQRRPIPRANTR